MKRSLGFWQFAGFVFVSVLGTLLHFLYAWTGESVIVAPFSAVNESIWEHMKLLFFPMFIFALIQSRYFKGEHENFWAVKLVGILIGLAMIPTIYYTYTGVFGKSAGWFNVIIFFISAAAVFLLETKLLKKGGGPQILPAVAFTIICIIGLIFVLFTFVPPQIPLFWDPTIYN